MKMTSLGSLDELQQRLGRTDENLLSGVQEHLQSNLLDYELTKTAGAVPAADPITLHSRAQEMLTVVMGVDRDHLSSLEPDDLLNLHRVVSDSEEVYRQEPVKPLNPAHESLDPGVISTAVERFFEWVRSPSFGEIHAIEQMTLAQIRLSEIQPFQDYSHLTVSLFSLCLILTKGYLMPLYRIEELPDFHQALEQAFRFSTEDLVHFNARACRRSYEYALARMNEDTKLPRRR